MLRRVHDALRQGARVVDKAREKDHAQDTPDLVVDHGLAHFARLDGGAELLLVEELAAARHFQVQARVRRIRDGVGRAPIRYDKPLEPAFALQEIGKQPGVLAAPLAPDLVVRPHDGPRIGLRHRRLERREIDLAQGALVDVHVDRAAIPFLVVAGVMLDRGSDSPALDSLHVRDGHAAGEMRILAEALEIAAAERRAVNVDAGTEKNVPARRARLVAQRLADLVHEFRIPGRGHRDIRGEARRLHAPADPVRAIGDPQRRNAEPREIHRLPAVLPGEQIDLFLQRHAREQIVDALFDREFRVLVRIGFLRGGCVCHDRHCQNRNRVDGDPLGPLESRHESTPPCWKSIPRPVLVVTDFIR